MNFKVTTPWDVPLTQHTPETMQANVGAAYRNGFEAGCKKEAEQSESAQAKLATIAGIVTRMSNYRQRNTANFQLEKFDDFIRELERELFAHE